ncbi:MAG: hypothetical protein H6814_04220 [Phycisphaeraceae bacterium]|nr:hypothetical protein [Phycisphaeraceae bacterium]
MELLVSIAVLALLIGIMIPTLGSARATGRRVVCASNIRQVQIANMVYAGDSADRFVPGAADIVVSNLHRWHGTRASAGVPFSPEEGDLTPYLDGEGTSRQVRACPSFEHAIEDLQSRGKGFERGCGGYGYNNAFVGTERELNRSGNWVIVDDTRGAATSFFALPASTIAFADAAFVTDELIEYSFVEPRKWPHRPRNRPDPSTHFRHEGRANVAWLDGHVTPESRTFTSKSGIYSGDPASFDIGWFGEDDDNRLYDYE